MITEPTMDTIEWNDIEHSLRGARTPQDEIVVMISKENGMILTMGDQKNLKKYRPQDLRMARRFYEVKISEPQVEIGEIWEVTVPYRDEEICVNLMKYPDGRWSHPFGHGDNNTWWDNEDVIKHRPANRSIW